VALDDRLERVVARLDQRVFAKRWRWVLALGAAVTLLLAGFTVVSALFAQLQSMHPQGTAGSPLHPLFGASTASKAVAAWRAFWDQAGARGRFREPRALAYGGLTIDTLVLMPSYLVAGLLVVLHQHRRPGNEPHVKPLLRWTGAAVVFLAVADVIENVLLWLVIRRGWGGKGASKWLDAILSGATTGKSLLAVLVVVTLILVGLSRWAHREAATRQTIRLVRAQLGTTVLAVMAMALPFQLPDVILRMAGGQATLALALAVVLALGIWSSGRLIVLAHAGRPDPAPGGKPVPRWLLAVLVLPFIVLALLIADGTPLIPVGLIAAVIIVGLPLRGQQATPPSLCRNVGDKNGIGGVMPRVLAAVVLAVVGLAVAEAAVNSFVQNGRIIVLGVLAVTLLLLAALADRLLDWAEGKVGVVPVVGLTVGALIVASAVELASPVAGPQGMGALAVVLAFFILTTVVGAGAVLLADWWVDRHDLPPAFAAFRFRAIPIFTMILIWGIVAATFDDGRHWDVRTRDGAKQDGVTLEAAFQSWLTAAQKRAPAASGMRARIPLVIVATSGGGIRAAYWTALAMDCLFSGRKASTAETDSNPCRHPGTGRAVTPDDVFVASGISGGSLGLVAWGANRDIESREGPQSAGWVEDRLGKDDYVSPSIARALLAEMVRTFIHFDVAGRAEILEDSWERSWNGERSFNAMAEPFLAHQREASTAGGPLLLISGASVFDGCALNVSILQAGSSVRGDPTDCLSVDRYRDPQRTKNGDPPGPLAATADVLDYLGCEEKGVVRGDIRRSTAALLSARWPYVSPAGRLTVCGQASTARFIVDGGYVDTSAAEAAIAVWDGLEQLVERHNATPGTPCVVPYFVQLDNGYLRSASPTNKVKPPNQILAPPLALLSTTGLQSRASRARAMAAERFTRPFGPPGVGDRHSIIVPRSHPGLEAPLAWTLAESSRRDLENELYAGNADAITDLLTALRSTTCP